MNCKIAGCTRSAQTRGGICRLHYNRYCRYGRYHLAEKDKPLPAPSLCAYPGCDTTITEAQPGFWVHLTWPFHVDDHLARPEA